MKTPTSLKLVIANGLLMLSISGLGQAHTVQSDSANANTEPITNEEGITTHSIPYFPASSNRSAWEGVLTITNHGSGNGQVFITATDDAGMEADLISLLIQGGVTKHVTATDIEKGNSELQLEGMTGPPSQGDWRLEVNTELRLAVNAFVKLEGGLLVPMFTSINEDRVANRKYHVATFGAGEEEDFVSFLRIINSSSAATTIILEAVDDDGERGGRVTMELAGNSAFSVNSTDLELGSADFEGAFGDGAGNWRIDVWANRDIEVLSLFVSENGQIVNVSGTAGAFGGPNLPTAPKVILKNESSLDAMWDDEFDGLFASYEIRGRYRDYIEEVPLLFTECVQLRGKVGGSAYSLTASVELDEPLIEGRVLQVQYRYFNNRATCLSGEVNAREWSRFGEAMVFSGTAETEDDPDNDPDPEPESTSDLIVSSIEIDNDTPEPGESVTLSLTVENIGDGAAPETTIRYFRSDNASITLSDSEFHSETFSGLADGSNRAQTHTFNAEDEIGTYFVGACLDAVEGESKTSNNCSEGQRIEVIERIQDGQPDLVVESIQLSDVALDARQSFTISATARNQGDDRSSTTTLRYFRSINAVITTGDTEVGSDSLSGLGPGSTVDESLALVAPSSAGTYHYGVCIDSVPNESNTDNNCSIGVQVEVKAEDDTDDEQDSYCRVDLTIQRGDRCDIYSRTNEYFSVSPLLGGCYFIGSSFLCSSRRLTYIDYDFAGTTITIDAQRNSNGSWTILRVEPVPP